MSVQGLLSSNVRSLRDQRAKEWQAAHRGDGIPNPWSQQAIALKLHISRPTYLDTEKGKRVLTVDDLLALALVFDVAPMSLLMPPDGAELVPISASASHGHVITAVGVSAFRSWIAGIRHLPGQHGGFFRRNALLHRPGRSPDARTAPWVPDSQLPDVPAVAPERHKAERALFGLWDALDSGDPEAVEHYQELLYESLNAAFGVEPSFFTSRPQTTSKSGQAERAPSAG